LGRSRFELRRWNGCRTGDKRHAGPQSTGVSLIDWELKGEKDHALTVSRRVRALRFIEPVETTVRREELPKRVHWRFRSILVVKHFGEDFILVDEYSHGFRVRAEVYHEELALPGSSRDAESGRD
jgi:hypothetical protein